MIARWGIIRGVIKIRKQLPWKRNMTLPTLALRGKATILPPDFREAHFDTQGKYAHKRESACLLS